MIGEPKVRAEPFLRLYCPFCRRVVGVVEDAASVALQVRCRWCRGTVHYEIQLRAGRVLLHVHSERYQSAALVERCDCPGADEGV